jgi:cephalosporin hydroxylase
MDYHGYIPFISKYAQVLYNMNKQPVKILEIGVDTGISLFGLNNNLNCLKVPFEYTGVDINIQPHVPISQNIFWQNCKENNINLVEQNSLVFLKHCVEIYDIILIDGDHNYETVSSECSYLRQISHINSLYVFDDYYGKYSLTDGFYADHEGYENNKMIQIKQPNCQKQGVKTAVDEFIENNEDIFSFALMLGEPLLMTNENNNLLELKKLKKEKINEIK